jgi:CheY-like chemotaxis protein
MKPTQRRVLVVEGDDDIREMISEVLSRAGYAVVPAASGQEALDEIGQVKPDVILLDLSMPDMDGPTFQKKQVAIDNENAAPLVLVASPVGGIETYSGVSAAAVFPKPFDMGKLLDVLAGYA